MTFETIITGYGLTETTGTATMCRHDDDPETIANWSGRAIPDTEVRIVDDDGNELPRGAAGRGRRRAGTTSCRATSRSPRRRRPADRCRRLAAHRRHRDHGRARLPPDHRPQEGHVHRRSASTRTRPRSRTCCSRNDAIGQVAVVGVPDERHGRGRDGVRRAAPRRRRVDPDELIAWAREQMANYKVPRYVERRRRAAAQRAAARC